MQSPEQIQSNAQNMTQEQVDALNAELAEHYRDIALAAFQGLLASGAYNTAPETAAAIAWTTCVSAFMSGEQQAYELWRRMHEAQQAQPSQG